MNIRENFPTPTERPAFEPLWRAHGIEVRGKPLELDFARYEQIERDGRLICVVARYDGKPFGYSWHYWYKSLHFSDRIGQDDLWYVHPDFRGRGIGKDVRRIGLDLLRSAGALETSDFIRNKGPWQAMESLGYKGHGTWWKRTL